MVTRGSIQTWLLVAAVAGGTLSSAWAQQGQPAGAAPAVAQPAISPLLNQIVQDLGSDDIVLRTSAQLRLIESEAIKLREIEGVIKDKKVGPEQRLRLMTVAYKRFCAEPRAALGVQSGMGDSGQRGVLLSMIMPGFPSAETLRPGDRVLNVDGQAITDITLMRPVVIARDPGDEVSVVVLRDGATLNLKVKLGRFTDLNARGGTGSMTAEMLEEAWALRSAPYASNDLKGEAKPIESGLAVADWKTTVQLDEGDGGDADSRAWNDARMRIADADPKDSGLVAAGEARGSGTLFHLANLVRGGGNFRVVQDQGVLMPGPNGQMPDGGAGGRRNAARQAELAMIRQAQDRFRKMIERNNSMLRSLPENKRRPLMQENSLLQLQIDELERMAQRPDPQPQLVKP